jgi:hypothetical protein
MADVALHSAIDVKCTCRIDYPGELKRTTVLFPAPQADGITSRSAIDVKFPHCFDYPGELRRMSIPVATKSWHAVGGVPKRTGWPHVVLVVVHYATDVKCTRRVDYLGELRRTAILIPARQASDVASRSTIDVKCARRADCPGELRGTVVPVPARKAGGVASRSATAVGLVLARRRGGSFDPRRPRLDEKIITNNNKCHFVVMLISSF